MPFVRHAALPNAIPQDNAFLRSEIFFCRNPYRIPASILSPAPTVEQTGSGWGAGRKPEVPDAEAYAAPHAP